MPMTYEQLAALTSDPVFRGKVKVAMLKYCDTMIIEPDNTTGHVSRDRWAKQAKQQPDMYAGQLQAGVCLDPAIQAAGGEATDIEIQGATEAEINKTV